MASGSKGRKAEESRLKAQAEAAQAQAAAAAQAVEKVDPLEESRRASVTAHDAWRRGPSPDIRQMPDQLGMSLYREAKQSRDAGRIGRGYGTLAGGANPNFAASLDRENQLERDLAAAGMLEGYVTDRDADVTREMYGLSGLSGDRSRYLADLAMRRTRDADERYNRFQQNKKPSFLKSLATGLLGNVGFRVGGGGGGSNFGGAGAGGGW